ncbi:dihydroorotate dehydrogenase [Neurospora sp. IMI 360204]|nr:dihydroorotate dehydrogenase [Neurospora sp. IMI 360204]
MTVPKLNINPPLINTPCPAATTLDDLLALWNCPSTGAITTRTSLISGFPHDDTKNLYIFYDSSSHVVSSSTNPSSSSATPSQNATLNSLGYSSLPLSTYLSYIRTIARHHPPPNGHSKKTIIISVTGSAQDIAECYMHIARLQSEIRQLERLVFDRPPSTRTTPLAMEINLSCPNIPHHPPPAYSREALTQYLDSLSGAIQATKVQGLPRIPVGLKTPPYTYETQFLGLMEALELSAAVWEGEGEGKGDEKTMTEKERRCQVSWARAD